MKFLLVVLVVLLSVVLSEAQKAGAQGPRPNPPPIPTTEAPAEYETDEEGGVKDDILEREGTFKPEELQPVDFNEFEEELKKLQEELKTTVGPPAEEMGILSSARQKLFDLVDSFSQTVHHMRLRALGFFLK